MTLKERIKALNCCVFFRKLDLEAFSNLEILNLRLNSLTGSVPSSIRALSSLKVLSLSNNRLNSSLSIQGRCYCVCRFYLKG